MIKSLPLEKPYSTLYIEEALLHTSEVEIVQNKFQNAEIIIIENHQEIFNRFNQDFRFQKLSPKIILAKKSHNFLYPGSPYTPSFNHPHHFYNLLALNCIYDCTYCYLQALYKSANLLLYLNLSDFFDETKKKLDELKSLYLCISYDTDLLALENIFPYCQYWYDFIKDKANLTIECRTKSANFNALKKLIPIDNFILAWTLSPEEVIKSFELKTPSLKARLKSINEAISLGWKVRLCFEPVLNINDWQNIYKNFISEVAKSINLDLVFNFAIGTFRLNEEHYKSLEKMHPDNWLYNFPILKNKRLITPKQNVIQELENYVQNLLISNNVPANKIFCFG